MKTSLMVSTKTIFMMGIGIALVSFVPHAQAEVASFSYEFASSGDTLSGTLDGALQGDGNTFVATTVDSLFVDGIAVTLPTLFSPDDLLASIDDPIEITLDGSYLNMYGTDGDDAFLFAVGDVVGDAVGATRGYGGSTNPEGYVQANWQASVAGVPEPSSAVLMLGPLGLLARRRAAHKTRRNG